MANKAISELPQAFNVNNQDLFVLEQSGIAKKLTAETFITEQGIIDALAEALDGHGGISSVTLSSVSGRIRTYLITFTDETTTTFQVLDGTSIDRITKTSTAGLTDTYTVFMNDGTTTFFTVTNGADGTVSEAMLNDALKDKAPAITETTESSAIANFTDGADDLVMHNIVAEIAPVQSGSGDPSPDNIRPITGWTGCNVTRTGKNLVDYSNLAVPGDNTQLQVTLGTMTLLAGTYTFSYTLNKTVTAARNRPMYIPLGESSVYGNDIKTAGRGEWTFTLTSTTTITLKWWYHTVSTNCTISDFQLEYAPSATAYESYIAPITASLSWQTEAGTVYGGTIDVATGLLTVDRVKITFDGTQTVRLANWRPMTNSVGWIYDSNQTPGLDNTVITNSNFESCKLLSDTLKTARYQGTDNIFSTDAPTISIVGSNPNGIVMRVNDTSLTTATAINAWLAEHPINVVYPLATPQTYQLTGQQLKTLLGTNNVWADTGDTSVTYPADTKMFIEKLTMPTEDDLVANQAITSGKYFMIGNSLYLALANIASGAQITIGTNAQRVSLADALNTINT